MEPHNRGVDLFVDINFDFWCNLLRGGGVDILVDGLVANTGNKGNEDPVRAEGAVNM